MEDGGLGSPAMIVELILCMVIPTVLTGLVIDPAAPSCVAPPAGMDMEARAPVVDGAMRLGM
jgi:hypothetical protein